MNQLFHMEKKSYYVQFLCGIDHGFKIPKWPPRIGTDYRSPMAPSKANERIPRDISDVGRQEAPSSIRLSEIISALSYALDLTEGQPMGHSVRACIIGMRLGATDWDQRGRTSRPLLCPAAQRCGMQQQRLAPVPHLECGRNSGQGRRENDRLDARGLGEPALRPHPCCHWHALPAAHAKALPGCRDSATGFLRPGQDSLRARRLHRQAAGIFRLRRRPAFTVWTSTGMDAAIPTGSASTKFPMFSRIANLSQTLDVFFTAKGPNVALEAAQKRSGRWFDPELVKAAASLANSGALWDGLDDRRPDSEDCIA